MKCRSHAINLVAALFAIFFASTAWAVTLSLTTSDTNLEPDDIFSVDIAINDATDIVGCTFTLRYPSDLVELAATDPVTTEFFALFQDNRQGASPDEIYPWEKNTTTDGLVRLAGVYVDPDDGMGAYTGKQTLFTLHFVVKSGASGPARITLEQTMLFNPDAGWGTDVDGDGEYDGGDGDEYDGAPILIKANEPGSQDEFEVVLEDFEDDPFLRIALMSTGTDSDGDGVSDATENLVDCCLDANNRDTDGDGLWDGQEIEDDGECAYDEGAGETNPCEKDTDGDGVSDGDEDVNKNGAQDGKETNPLSKYSDGDIVDDGVERSLGTDPMDENSYPDVICIGEYDESECHDQATSVADAKANVVPYLDGGPVYFWIRSIIDDETMSLENQELLGIDFGGRVSIPPTD